MACYSPLLARRRAEGEKILIYGHIKDLAKKDFEVLKSGEIFTIPCGKCLGCRLDYSRHWADRMVLEYEACGKAVFVTLTYEDKNLPDVNPETGEHFNHITDLNEDGKPIAPLIKTDVSEFIKCLRSKLHDNHYDIPVRFFACGEHGEHYHRPHYHIILFGIDLSDLQTIVFSGDIKADLEPWTKNELNQVSYRSNLLEDVWKERGIVTVSDVSYETMAYVGRYSLKKAQGDSYTQKYDLPKEFTLMSRRPGIGAPFLEKNGKALEDVSVWFFHGKDIYWPSYLLKKYFTSPGRIEVIDVQDPIHYNKGDELPKLLEIKAKKQEIAVNNFMNTFEKDERPYYQKQEFLRRQKEHSVSKLKRGDAIMV